MPDTSRPKLPAKGIVRLVETPVSGRAAAIREGILDKDILKRAYETGLNLSRYLEILDPSADHPSNGGGMDAFNRVLRACGIVTRSIPELGIQASTLEDVVQHPQARHLAVELIARAYRRVAFASPQERVSIQSGEGIPGSFLNQFTFAGPRDILVQPAIPLAALISRTTGVNGNYFRPFYLEEVVAATTATGASGNSRVSEAAEIPAVRIATSEKTVNLYKYGRRLDVTYEASRRIPIDLLAFFVSRIAIAIEAEKVDKVLGIIVNGDGNSGSAATSYNLSALDAAAGGNLTLKAWLAFKMKFKNPLALTTVLGQDTSILSLMMLNSGSANIPLVALGGLFPAQAVTPINQGLRDGVRAGWLDSAPANKLVGFDSRFSIERLFEIGGQIQETDKDVQAQIDSLVLSEVEGYDVFDFKANKILNLAA